MIRLERRGFSVVELLVVVLLGCLILMAAYQVLATNTRIYAVNRARSQGQQTLRGATDVLSGELREISSIGGDLLTMGANSLTVRAQRKFGLVCGVDYAVSPPRITVLTVGPAFQAQDSIFVFHDNDPERSSDDEWHAGTVSAVDPSGTCGGNAAHVLSVPLLGGTAAAIPPDSVRVGAPVRSFQVYSYEPVEYEGEWYLGRRSGGASVTDPLVGPLLHPGGIAFRYLDGTGQATTEPTLVAQIELTLRYRSALNDLGNQAVSDSIAVRVYLRN